MRCCMVDDYSVPMCPRFDLVEIYCTSGFHTGVKNPTLGALLSRLVATLPKSGVVLELRL